MATVRILLAACIAAAFAAACGGSSKPADGATAQSKATPAPEGTAEASAATPPPAVKLTAHDCSALIDEAQHELDAERIAVDKLCKKDVDCMAVKAHACDFGCANASIPKGEEGDWNDTVKKVDEGPCKKWNQGSCSTVDPKPAPECKQRAPKCEGGHCVMR